MIYLDNSATTYPKPQSVRRRMAEALERFGANPGRGGFRMSMETAQAVYAVRRKAAALFGAPGPECVSFQPSCTQALNIVIHSLQPGDHVLVTDLEHNAVLRPLKAMEAHGVSFTVVPVTPCDNDATLDAFRRAIRENTRMFICTQASNVWGIRVPVERLAALAHVYGAEICVDAAQSGGVVPIRAAEDNIDYLCCAGHKGLYGPMGTGLLITGRGEKLKSLIQGGTGTLALQLEQPRDMPEYLESGTQNVPGILALGAGIDFVRARGEDNLRQAEMRHVRRIHAAFSRMPHVKLYTPPPDMRYFVPVLGFNVRGMASEAVGDYLAKHGIAVRCGFHCAPFAHRKMGTDSDACGGAVRISPSAFTDDRQVDGLIRAVSALQKAPAVRGQK